VYATCRKSTPELAALGVHVVEGIDVARDDVVGALGAALAWEGRVDLVIANGEGGRGGTLAGCERDTLLGRAIVLNDWLGADMYTHPFRTPPLGILLAFFSFFHMPFPSYIF
jgi:hypothetical protein